ncbi:TadE family protein [Cohnella fermenti]|nr:TadE family protein [Cohnella fermenti]
MKRLTRRMTLINKRKRDDQRRGESRARNGHPGRTAATAGTVTLEAALVMPVFLLVIVFLIFLIRTCVTEMALDGALSQTTRQTASMWYVVSKAQESFAETKAGEAVEAVDGKLEDIRKTLEQYGNLLPAPLSDWASDAAGRSWSIEENAAIPLLEKVMKELADPNVLDVDRLDIVNVTLPSGTEGDGFLTVEAEYRLPMGVPFLGRSLILRSSAKERAWVGGTPSTALLNEGDEEGGGSLAFLSMEPSPARPGRRVTLSLKAEPGQTVELSVYYKSGQSTAKHLGQATADSEGLVAWTWLVSGNTTSGAWAWEAKISAGTGTPLSQSFLVSRS